MIPIGLLWCCRISGLMVAMPTPMERRTRGRFSRLSAILDPGLNTRSSCPTFILKSVSLNTDRSPRFRVVNPIFPSSGNVMMDICLTNVPLGALKSYPSIPMCAWEPSSQLKSSGISKRNVHVSSDSSRISVIFSLYFIILLFLLCYLIVYNLFSQLLLYSP